VAAVSELIEVFVEAIEAFRPYPALPVDPIRSGSQRAGFEPAGSGLAVPAA
jgi:hypothetical protein